jgi:hypothetical protein
MKMKNTRLEEELPPIWLVPCRLEINNPDILSPEKNRLQDERARIHNDLRAKFKYRQITHSILRYGQQVVDTSLWLISSEKAREEIGEAIEQWNGNNKGNGCNSSVGMFPIVTNKIGREI